MNYKKWCFVATEVKGGWRLKLVIGDLEMKAKHGRKGGYKERLFKTVKSVENFANAFVPADGKIVFVHLKESKFKAK